MKIIDVQQNTPEWFAARCGIPSASNFDKIVTSTGAPSKQREKYLYKLAGEKITGLQEETYQNATMQRGIEMEDEARLLYEVITGSVVKQVGFCITEGEIVYGCSPDGLVYDGMDDGLVEIKCPIMTTQVSYLLKNKLPTEYFQQVQGQMLVTNRKWCDFVSYYPGLKPLVVRVERDEVFLKALKVGLAMFCFELESVIEKIR